MLEVCKRHAYTTKGRVKISICMSTIFIVAMVFGLLVMARPYAVFATGEKVNDAWAVKVNGQEVAVVESKEAGEAVVAGVKTAYIKDIPTLQQTDIGKDVVIEKYQFIDATKHPVIMTVSDAVAHIIKINEQGKATAVSVEITTVVEESVEVPYEVETVQSNEYYEGRTGVVSQGEPGENLVTSEVTTVNGKEVSRRQLSSQVIKEPITEVQYTGTYPKPQAQSTSTNRGGGATTVSRPSFNPTGNSVVDYGLQFLGTPYVYGGTSLSGGIDCSGFTMMVYSKFGVSLPHSSSAQRSCGYGVSYSDAMPGDIICYSGHVALYMGNGQIVHANGYGRGIQISNATYNTILAVRRVI